MARRQISVLCIQETHSRVSEKYLTFGNFLVLVAGHDKKDQREYASVGFIIAPHMYLQSFARFVFQIGLLV